MTTLIFNSVFFISENKTVRIQIIISFRTEFEQLKFNFASVTTLEESSIRLTISKKNSVNFQHRVTSNLPPSTKKTSKTMTLQPRSNNLPET